MREVRVPARGVAPSGSRLAGLTALVAPSDGSGVIEPEATYQPGDRLSFRAILYVPFGAGPRGVTLDSFYGATPRSAYVQVRYFD